jgi:HPt (histidine-containing phosphotransfer) domain-containing protein
MDDYIAKPFNVEQLAKVLRRWVPHSERGGGDRGMVPSEAAVELPIPEESDQESINRKALDNIRAVQRKGAPSILGKVIRTYLKNAKQQIDALEKAVHSRDSEALHAAAHSFKSSSSNVGAHLVAARCRALEELGKTGTTEGADRQLADLIEKNERACRALERELEKCEAPSESIVAR